MTEHSPDENLVGTGRRDEEVRLASLVGVREHTEGAPVELWRNRAGRVIIRSYNECGNNVTDVDLYDLIDWLSTGPGAKWRGADDGTDGIASRGDHSGGREGI